MKYIRKYEKDRITEILRNTEEAYIKMLGLKRGDSIILIDDVAGDLKVGNVYTIEDIYDEDTESFSEDDQFDEIKGINDYLKIKDVNGKICFTVTRAFRFTPEFDFNVKKYNL
jgi:hypothetical protein